MILGCEQARERIALWLAGEAGADEGRALEEHLGGCPSCSTEAEQTRRTLDLLAVEDVPDPGPVYWSSFGARLNARIDGARRRKRMSRLVAAAAAVAFLVVGLAIARLPRERSQEMAGGPAGMDRSGSGGPRPLSVEETETRLREALQRAVAEGRGTRELESILDEIAPADPFEEGDGHGDLSPERHGPSGGPADSRG